MQIVKTLLRVLALIFHLFQTVISITAGLYVSAVVGAFLFGVYMYDFKTIQRLFHANPLVISGVGSIAWFAAAVVETSMLDSPPKL